MLTETEKPGKAGRPRKVRQGGRQLRRTTVLLPGQLLSDLDAAAEACGLDSRAAVIRQACTQFLRQIGGRPYPATAAECI